MKNLIVCLMVLVISAMPALGATWTGGGDATSWSDPANWDAAPSGTTVHVNGAHTVIIDVDDSINSLRIGDGAMVTIPAGITLSDMDIGESSGLGWWSGASSELIVEGTYAFGDNNGNLWLSDMWTSGPSILRVQGNGVVDTAGWILGARHDSEVYISGNASVTAGGMLVPYHDFGAGTLNSKFRMSGGSITTSEFGYSGNSLVDAVMTGGTIDTGSFVWGGGATGSFTFSAGTISIAGDQRGFGAANDWFITGPNYDEIYDDQIDTTMLVPEPMTICLLGLGGLLIRRKR